VNATTKARPTDATDRELALQLGSVMLHIFGSRGGSEVIRVIDESGLSFIQMKAVITIGGTETDGAATTVTELSETLGVSPASASRAADGLVKRKLATRVEDPEDRRVRRLELTAKGRELADRIVSARLAGIEDFMASLESAERAKLAAALEALMEREELTRIYRSNSERAGR
jgi:DNA-binding MarR family transcriptional regulator